MKKRTNFVLYFRCDTVERLGIAIVPSCTLITTHCLLEIMKSAKIELELGSRLGSITSWQAD